MEPDQFMKEFCDVVVCHSEGFVSLTQEVSSPPKFLCILLSVTSCEIELVRDTHIAQTLAFAFEVQVSGF